MKVIANIPEEMLQELKDGCFGAKHTLYDLAGAICDGDVLPDNATNGDMIKAMFPKGKVRREVSCTHDKTVFSFPDGTYFGAECRFNTDWWNEPYKGGQEDGKA